MKQQLSVLYIHTHDSGRIFSPYGYQAPTPHIQAFAEDAMTFRKAYCASPTCSPSRSSLLTGQYPHNCGMLGLTNRGFALQEPSHHLVYTLKQNGFHTALCGIQHESGTYYDHREAASFLGYDEDITTSTELKGHPDPLQWDRENAIQASAWIHNRRKDQPFFLSYGQFATHRPYPAPDPADRSANYVLPPFPVADHPITRADYAGHIHSVASADRNVGLLLQALKESGWLDRSIIIFTTDHGIAFPGMKCTLTDAGTGVALIMRTPAREGHGVVNDNLTSHVDVFPTLCDLLEMPRPEWLEGESFARCFQGDMMPHRDAVFSEINFHTSYEPVRSIRSDRFKYVLYVDDEYLDINLSNIDDSPSKQFLIDHGLELKTKAPEALYDLYHDPAEKNNVIGDPALQSVLDELRKKLADWQTMTRDPLLSGPIIRQDHWKVNKKTCRSPHSQSPDDFEA